MLVGKNDNAQFMAEKSDQKKDLYKLLDQLINDLREIERVKTEKLKGGPAKRIYPVQVMVVGTEERAYQSFQKHTVFVTEVSIGKAAIKIFVRYSEVRRLCDQLKSTEFVKQYGILNIKTEFAASNWMTNQKTKVIENRKLQIEGFLQQILQTQIIRERPLLVLNYLSILLYHIYYQAYLRSSMNCLILYFRMRVSNLCLLLLNQLRNSKLLIPYQNQRRWVYLYSN